MSSVWADRRTIQRLLVCYVIFTTHFSVWCALHVVLLVQLDNDHCQHDFFSQEIILWRRQSTMPTATFTHMQMNPDSTVHCASSRQLICRAPKQLAMRHAGTSHDATIHSLALPLVLTILLYKIHRNFLYHSAVLSSANAIRSIQSKVYSTKI